MKTIDALAGTPLCMLAGPLVRALTLVRRRNRPIRRLLIIKCFGLGSIAMMTSILHNLRRHHPDVRVTFLTFDNHRRLLELVAPDVKILTVSKRSLPALLGGTLALLARLPLGRFDAVLDLEFFSRYTQLLAGASLAPQRIGFDLPRFWRRAMYTERLHYNQSKHMVDAYMQSLRLLGLKADERRLLPLRSGPEAKARLNEKIKFDPRRTIGININASDFAHCRRWPPRRFAQLIARLAREGWDIALTGAPGERAYVEQFHSRLPERLRGRVHDLAGRLDLDEFIALLESLPLLITNDSGPFHLAYSAGCRTVSIWGPSDPLSFGPLDKSGRHETVYLGLQCSPCLCLYGTEPMCFCDGRVDCLANLDVDLVWEIVKRLLPDSPEEYGA